MEHIDSRPMEDQNYEYCVETIDENEILYLLHDLHRKIDNVEKKFDQRMLVIEKGVDAIVGAFQGYYQENLNFRNEIKNAFRLTARKIFEADTADFELILPCNTPKSVAVLEKRVRNDAKAKSELRRRLFDLNGKDWQAFVRRALELVWRPQAAESFSWSGQRMNVAVKNFKLILMIKDVTRVKYKLASAEMGQLDHVMKRWFFYAGSRSRTAQELDINDPAVIVNKKQLREEITDYVDSKTMSSSMGASDDEKNNFTNDSIDPEPEYIEMEGEESYEIEQLDDHNSDSGEIKPMINFEGDNEQIKFSKTPENLNQTVGVPTEMETVEVKPIVTELSVPVMSQKLKDDGLKLKSFRLPRSVADLLPIKSNEDIQKAEILLKVDKYRIEMLDVLRKMKRECKETNVNFSKIFSDPFLKEYSWNGKNDHKSLETLILSKLLIEAWKEPNQGAAEFEKALRVCVFQSHTRTARNQLFANKLPVKKQRMN